MGVPPATRLRSAALMYRFRESLFAVPALMLTLGVLLAELTGALDQRLDSSTHVPGALQINSNAATWLLSTVAGATITTAGVVFSMTVVSLQLASSQFSPRVMRSFIRDRLSQLVIGLLVATFVFCVLTLRRVSPDAQEPAPRISMSVAIVLTVATVLLIVAHLDHLARRLQVGEVVRTIADEGASVVAAIETASAQEQPITPAPPQEGSSWTVVAPRDGWVTQALGSQMLAFVPPGTVVRLETRTGAYIHAGEALATLRPRPSDPERISRTLTGTVTVAPSRTMQEDVDFALRQLVDVGLRAMSPAVNDPTTAVEVVLRVGSLIRRLLLIDLPAEAVAGPDGRVLLRPWNLRHDEYIAHAFDQLRRTSLKDPVVVAALLRVLRMLVVHVVDNGRSEHVDALEEQIRGVIEALREDGGLRPEELARLEAISAGTSDPADHAPVPPEPEVGPRAPRAGRRGR